MEVFGHMGVDVCNRYVEHGPPNPDNYVDDGFEHGLGNGLFHRRNSRIANL
jgi:hypothetical protein